MRIAFIGPFGMEPKGTMRVRALPLAKALAGRGHQVALFLPPFHTPEAGNSSWQEDGVTVENVPVSQWPLLGYGITSWRLARQALAWKPDIIHLFKPKAYSGLAHWLLWWWRRLGGRRLGLFLDSDDWEGWGGWNDLEPYPPWQKRFFAWQEKWGLTHADRLAVASRALGAIAWSLGVPAEKVVYLPNGVAGLVEPNSESLKREAATILLYTRFFEFDVGRVVALLGEIRKKVPEARLVVVGKGLFGEELELMAAASASGLDEALDYVGWVEADQLPAFFAAASCAIYPFDDKLLNRTKCAVKLLDLLAAGVPVVAEAVGQNRGYIQDGHSGFLVPPGDDAAFVSAVVRVLAEPALREVLAAGARQRVAAGLMRDQLVERVELAYLSQ